MYSSIGRPQPAKSGECEAVGALEGGILLELEPVDAMPGKKASSRRVRTFLVLMILMRLAIFTRTAMYTIYMTALTRRVCHRRCRSGSAGIRRRACRCVLMGRWWLSVVMIGHFELLWTGLVFE